MIHRKKNSLTKIICTIGNVSSDVETLVHLAENGMSVARMNMSHGTHQSHQSTINNIREAEKRLEMTIGIALDTRGPELRVGDIEGGELDVCVGDEVVFTNDPGKAGGKATFLPFSSSLELKKGDRVFIDDGLLKLEVLGLRGPILHTRALSRHVVKPKKGVNIPGVSLKLPYLSSSDKEDIAFGLENKVDFVFASFVTKDTDVLSIKAMFSGYSHQPEVIAKIESPEGLQNLEAILGVSDGVMIARGDLAVEIGHEKVFPAQKRISRMCLEKNKVLICATQMMESMVERPFPTRAEVSDVGNAVLDGCDCVMLSAETASGKFPVETVKAMKNVCLEAELLRKEEGYRLAQCARSMPEASKSAAHNEREPEPFSINASSIREVDLLRSTNPNIPVYVASDAKPLLRRLQIRKCCFPAGAHQKNT